MKPCLFAIAAATMACLPPPNLFANGGGYITGGTAHTGAVVGFEPRSTGSIRMAEEDLRIKFGPKSAKVELRYRMENQTKRRVAVRFGFPVEESPAVRGLGIAGFLTDSSQIEPHTSLLYCKNYRIFDGQNQLKPKWQAENRAATDERFTNLAGWQVSEVAFAPGEAKEWRISFESVYPTEVRWVSDDDHVSPALFKYRLSTAACWAGTIGKGRIVLEPDGIDPEEVRIIKPVNRFRKEGRNWVWEFENLEPTLADDLEIEAQPEVFSKFRQGESYVRRGEHWSIAHSNYNVVASSTLAPQGEFRYDAENLKRYDAESFGKGKHAWSEGAEGPGVGEWLEITPQEAKPLLAISLSSGFSLNDKKLYKANARPKTVRLELNGEHTATMELPDSPEEFRYVIEGYKKPVAKIRLTFEEVWPGSHFEDLCIRQLRLHVRIDRKPEFQSAR